MANVELMLIEEVHVAVLVPRNWRDRQVESVRRRVNRPRADHVIEQALRNALQPHQRKEVAIEITR